MFAFVHVVQRKESFTKEILMLNEQASQLKEELSSINNELKESGGMSFALSLSIKDIYLESNEELKKGQAVLKMSRAKDTEIEILKRKIKEEQDVHNTEQFIDPLSSTKKAKPLSVAVSFSKTINEGVLPSMTGNCCCYYMLIHNIPHTYIYRCLW